MSYLTVIRSHDRKVAINYYYYYKSGGCRAHFRGGAGSPSNTMSPGPRPTSVLSGILIHPTVWPQYTNVTYRQTDRQKDRQRSYSIRRTVTCNGRPKIL